MQSLDEIRADRLGRGYRARDNIYVVGFSPVSRHEYFVEEKPDNGEMHAFINKSIEKMLALPPEKRHGIGSYMVSVYPFLSGFRLAVEFGKASYSNMLVVPESF